MDIVSFYKKQYDIVNEINNTSDMDRVVELGSELFICVMGHIKSRNNNVNEDYEILKKLLKTVSCIPNEIKRNMYANKIADDYHLSRSLVMSELNKTLGKEHL